MNSTTITGTDVPHDSIPAFPAEHYSCPPWCEVNGRPGPDALNHDSTDGMPDWPGFHGYNHRASVFLPYATAPANPPGWVPAAPPLGVHLELGPDTMVPGLQIGIATADDHDINLTLEEAEALAWAILQHVSTARAVTARALA